jgi:hypothetical protein
MTRKLVTPPFVECQDDHRCAQTIILMILKHFLPDKEWTRQEADEICYYIENLHTWDTAPIKGMVERGFEVVHFCRFDPDKYIADPKNYLYEYYDKKTADYMVEYDDVDRSVRIEKELKNVPHYRHVKRDWQWTDVEQLLDDGYLILTWLNPRKLYNRHKQDEVSGHFVLLFGYNSETKAVMVHDGGGYGEVPGEGFFQMNALKSYRLGSDHFMHAAKSDKTDGGNFIAAFRLRKN